MILAHWHYFNCNTDPTTLDEQSRGKSILASLTPEEFVAVTDLWKQMRTWRDRREGKAHHHVSFV